MKSIPDVMLSCLEYCAQRGMKAPYIVCAINAHGSVMCLRFTERHSERGPLLKAHKLCEHENAGLLLGDSFVLSIVGPDGTLAGFQVTRDNDTFVVKQ